MNNSLGLRKIYYYPEIPNYDISEKIYITRRIYNMVVKIYDKIEKYNENIHKLVHKLNKIAYIKDYIKFVVFYDFIITLPE